MRAFIEKLDCRHRMHVCVSQFFDYLIVKSSLYK